MKTTFCSCCIFPQLWITKGKLDYKQPPTMFPRIWQHMENLQVWSKSVLLKGSNLMLLNIDKKRLSRLGQRKSLDRKMKFRETRERALNLAPAPVCDRSPGNNVDAVERAFTARPDLQQDIKHNLQQHNTPKTTKPHQKHLNI